MTGPDAKNPGSSPFSPSPTPPFSAPVAAPNASNAVPARHAKPTPRSPRLSVSPSASRSSLRAERERHGSSTASQPRQQVQRQSAARVSASKSPTPPPLPPPEAAEQPQSRPRPKPQPRQDPQDQQPRPLPPFAPLFALLTSTSHPTNRQTTHHPTVRYIFADDDPEALTAALAQHHATGATSGDADADSTPADRAVVLDIAPTADRAGFEVACASSLSPDWAVVSARLGRMPGGGAGVSSLAPAAGGEEAEPGDGAVAGGNPRSASPGTTVLQIEGVSVESGSLGLGPTKMGTLPDGEMQSSGASGMTRLAQAGAGTGGSAASATAEEYAGLVEDFEKRMGLLRRVVEAGEERRRMLARETEEREAEGVYKKDAPPARGIRDETAAGGEREVAENKGERE